MGSVAGGAALYRIDIGLAVWRAATALAFPQHRPQAFHHFVVSLVQIRSFGGQQFNRLANAFGLVDGALLTDRQMHGQMQKRIALAVVKVAG